MKKLIAVMLFVMLPIVCFTTARADSGPKPSVNVSFESLSGELCYGTLLSVMESTGPAKVWDGTPEDARHNENERFKSLPYGYEIWKAFVDYADKDGYYFLQQIWQVNETNELNWGYYPPNTFKVLLYFPESGTFFVSGSCERYAFDSYFTVDLSGNKQEAGNHHIEMKRSYNYGQELFSLVARIILTIGIELVIAWLFGYRNRNQWILLVSVNAVTQIILNVLLNVINYRSGHQMFMTYYFVFELIVIVIEASVYRSFLCEDRSPERGKRQAAIYALVANAVSFVGGVFLARWIPGIF